MNKQIMVLAAWLSASALGGDALAEFARNYVVIVGSTTIQPFAAAVADHVGKPGKTMKPKIESAGSGGGIALFCEGLGMEYPDIAIASRAMRKRELETCRANGVNEVVEVKIGYGGIALTHSKKSKPMDLTSNDVYLALAKLVPDPACKNNCGKLVPNPYQTWKQVNPALPDTKIEVWGPPLNSGAQDAFAESVLAAGCNSYPWLAAKKDKNELEYKKMCYVIRNDGAYTELADDNDDSIVQKLISNPNALGIHDYQLLAGHTGEIGAVTIDGVTPNSDSIASQKYPVSRPLFLYVKKAQVTRIPGLKQYLGEFTGDKAWGDKGYLVAKGLIAMPAEERKAYAAAVKNLKPMSMDSPSPQPK